MNTHDIYFHGEIKKKQKKHQYFWASLFKVTLSIVFIFIDHKSRMIQTDSSEFCFFITCL